MIWRASSYWARAEHGQALTSHNIWSDLCPTLHLTIRSLGYSHQLHLLEPFYKCKITKLILNLHEKYVSITKLKSSWLYTMIVKYFWLYFAASAGFIFVAFTLGPPANTFKYYFVKLTLPLESTNRKPKRIKWDRH